VQVATVLEKRVVIIVKVSDLSILENHASGEGEKQEEILEKERPEDPRDVRNCDVVLREEHSDQRPDHHPGDDPEERTIPEADPIDLLRLLSLV
jgi:hypothetical protein